jgi:hypothetical protein
MFMAFHRLTIAVNFTFLLAVSGVALQTVTAGLIFVFLRIVAAGVAELAAGRLVVLTGGAVGEDEQEGEENDGRAAHGAVIRPRGLARRAE